MTTFELVLLVVAAAGVTAAATALALARRTGTGGEGTAAVEAQVSRLADAVGRSALDDQVMREGLERTRAALHELRIQTDERRRSEEEAWAVVSRLEAVLRGGSSQGRAGENLLEEALSDLPPAILVRNFSVGGKRVEFALVLPNGRRLPVDSKWTAVRELECLEAEEDPMARQALARKVEDEVARRAREVSCYLDASMTTPFAVACVPDAAFAVCRRAHADAFTRGVVVVPYGTAVPTILGLYALAQRYGDAGDVQACLAELDGVLQGMEQVLENKVVKATTMLENATVEWRTGLGKARGALARGRDGGGAATLAEDPERVLRPVSGVAASDG